MRLPFRGPTDEFLPVRGNPAIEAFWVHPNDYKGDCGVIILPGSGATIADLTYFRQCGGERLIREHLSKGGIVVGVCGGFQMLGEVLLDPFKQQGDCERVEGLGYLPITTLFGPEMLSCRTTATLIVGEGTGGIVEGEERRSGVSFPNQDNSRVEPLLAVTKRHFHTPQPQGRQIGTESRVWQPGSEEVDGLVTLDRKVWGSYFHLIFHAEPFLTTFFKSL